MSTTELKSKPTLGFFTVLSDPQHGLFGGFLVLNLAGRPLEFHCTAPVRPNRAQEILYGPTLEPFLYGEQIGRTLLERAQAKPVVVCTDRLPAMAVREHVRVPVALVLAPFPPSLEDGGAVEDETEPGRAWRLDAAHAERLRMTVFQVGRNRLAVSGRGSDEASLLAERLAVLDASFDLSEPFERIREAIEEARCGGS